MPDWFPDWSGQRCMIVASGPSAVQQPVYEAEGRARTIAINNSWRLAPWADVLYASDAAWWRENDHAGFAGLKVSRGESDVTHKVALTPVENPRRDYMDFSDAPVVGAGGCSGFQALNLAYKFGARDIALVGFDARVDAGVHWHGRHERTANPTESTAAIWAMTLDRAAAELSERGARVVNCSPVSALTAYEKVGLRSWLRQHGR